MEENFAVFESIGEDWEQITIWVDYDKAIKYLYDWRKRCPSRYYSVLEKKDA